MPYFISNNNPDCSGWAVEKEDGEVIGCHSSKDDAIAQMVAVSLAEEMEPGGERALAEELNVNDYVMWFNGDDLLQGQIIEIAFDGELLNPNNSEILLGTAYNPAALIRVFEETEEGWFPTEELVLVSFERLREADQLEDAIKAQEGILEDSDLELRQVNLTPPSYMRAAARRGLRLYEEGKGGDGLVARTIREAREMAAGRVTADKWVRIAAWIARHMPDLDAPKNSNPNDPEYPGAGLVAHLLWGSGPSKAQARRAMEYAQGVVERIRAEEEQSRWSSVNIQLKKEKEAPVSKVERRVKNDIDFEIRMENAEADGMRFSGYAAVFNSDSEPLPFIERILPGAFKRSLKARNEVKLFKNHNMDEVLASTRSKTLRLVEDEKGLLAEAILPDTTAGRDLAVLMKRGDVHSMSFGFSVPAKGDSWNADGTVRELREIRLHEVSIVTGFPAYEATTASVRSLDILATRTAVDADKLADVMLKLEAGETLPSEEADLLVEVVTKLRDKTEEVKEDLSNLELKRKALELLFKAV